jgi:primary-amine oxidase
MTTSSDTRAPDRNQLVHDIDRPDDHPLRRLTPAEMTTARGVLDSDGYVTEHTRFVYIGLEEPDKNDVLAYEDDPSHHVDRRARLHVLDRANGQARHIVVSLTRQAIVSDTLIDPVEDGQMALLDEEFAVAEEIVARSEEWKTALRRRGLDPAKVRGVPLSAGHFGFADEVGKRIARVVGFCQDDEQDLPWAHPVDGLVAYVDLIAQCVHKLVDAADLPVPRERGEWNADPHASPPRTTLKPIEITQSDGASFTIDNDVLTWENWAVRVGFDAREGLTLHQVSFLDNGRRRPILYRASVAEMVVFYADPSPARFYQNYFDTGEYMFCRYTNSLKLGCDCLGEIHYLDATIANDHGEPRTVENAICIHEEDYGLLWKHNDMFNGMSESRRSRRLVISFFTTIGNYDYGFYWYFYLDGTIELEAKATGVVFTSALPHGDSAYANEVAPGLGAPFHQHMFCARLDMSIDGHTNAVDEIDAAPVPIGPDNPFGNAFGRNITRLHRESDAQRIGDAAKGRVWKITNPTVHNRLGNPVGYVLHSQNAPLMLADTESSTHRRATFATKHLWVTRYSGDERYPAGEYVYQNHGNAGLPQWVCADRSVDDEDIVLWHTFGLTHFPRPEDWPIMPMDYAGFKLKADGFFDRNPTLDVPASVNTDNCAHH